MIPLTENTRACLMMSASMAGFTINDIIIKGLTDTMATGQIMAVRGAFMALLLFLWMRWRATPMTLESTKHPMVWLRTLGEAIATVFFLFALARVPIASVSAVLQALPLAVTLGAALFFGERVGWRRISAILAGLLGVMMVIKPGADTFDPAILAVIGTVLFAAARDLATRALPPTIDSLHVSQLTTLAVTVLGVLMMVISGTQWVAMSLLDVFMLFSAAIFLFVGYHCIILAMRMGETSVVAPFRYTSLLWAILLGMVFFAEVPDALSLVGATIIVASGIYTIYREARVKNSIEAVTQASANNPPARGT